ncbi:MAG: dihydroorotate dehydrogenase [candidate division KSB1 bacterium]|nr:dihydroorotate dehydrogenase [candidate division KSB1 bacterium]MDZ7377453.1 dihydroorotate dehydrogenase [candidate division KSB1 bacterium]MDZ7401213.1 dihydroorotate dehydrogenase [candidate division KSB1 bacterium]
MLVSDLSVKLGPLTLRNPILTASGTFGYGEEYASFYDLNRLGGLVTKAVSLTPRPGNPGPRIAETCGGMLNSIGLANVGVKKFISDKLPFLKQLTCAVIVNVAGKTVEDFARVVAEIEAAGGVNGYELNVSCPNVKEGGMAFSADPHITASVTRLARQETDRCLIVKLSPNVTSISEIAISAESAGADALSVINTLVGMAVDIQTRRPKLATITGGLSGPAIKPIAIAKVFEVVRAVKIPVIGIGGIMHLHDVLEFLITGATAVQIGTANFVDPDIGARLVTELEKYVEQHQIHKMNELIGSIQLQQC